MTDEIEQPIAEDPDGLKAGVVGLSVAPDGDQMNPEEAGEDEDAEAEAEADAAEAAEAEPAP